MGSPGKGRKRKTPPETPPKMSVKERTSRFEQVKEKYKSSGKEIRKEINRVKHDTKEKKPKNEDEDGSISNLLKTINANILAMKSDLKTNSEKIDGINDRICDIEVKADKSEKENQRRFDAISANVDRIETNVTDKAINIVDPQIKLLKAKLKADMASELRSIVDEEIKKRFPSVNEEGEPDEKNSKNQKKNIKPAK